MAQFNPNDYETVAERITRLYKDFGDARIITENVTTPQDRAVLTWIVKATLYLSAEDQANYLPKATGYAFEIDGVGMANKTSALENAETSAIGRCLANAGYSGDRRASREEMAKAQRGVTPVAPTQRKLTPELAETLAKAIASVPSKEELRKLWNDNADVLDQPFVNSLGDSITLKQLFMSKSAEVAE